MCRITSGVLLLAGLFVTIPAFAAEPLVVDLWPGKTPGDVGIKGQETSRIHQSPLVGPTKLITNVTKPTLTIYRPPQGQEHGDGDDHLPGRRLLGPVLGARRRGSGGVAELGRHDRHHPQVPLPAAARGRPAASRRWARSSTPSGPSAWSAAGPRNGASTPSGSASSASRRAAISRWRPRPTSRSGCMNRSTPSTRSVAGPISPSCAIRAI